MRVPVLWLSLRADGDALSGWQVVSVRMATYALPLCQRYTASSSQLSAADDPAPLVSELLYTDKRIAARPATCAAVLDANREDPAFLPYTRQNLDGSNALQDRPLNVSAAVMLGDCPPPHSCGCFAHVCVQSTDSTSLVTLSPCHVCLKVGSLDERRGRCRCCVVCR